LKDHIEGVMIAAGQNLKRLLKHRLEEKFCFFRRMLEFLRQLGVLIFFISLSFFETKFQINLDL